MTYRAVIRRKCYTCNGIGEEQIVDSTGILVDRLKCKRCKGTGKVEEEIEVVKLTANDIKETRII